MASLIVTDLSTNQSREVLLSGYVVSLGKASDNDIVLDRVGISRHHCELHLLGGEWIVKDPGSRNGVFIQGQRLSREVPLAHGQSIQIADFKLTLQDKRNLPQPGQKAEICKKRTSGKITQNRQLTPPALKKKIHTILLDQLDLKHTDMTNQSQEELYRHTAKVCAEIVAGLSSELPGWLAAGDLVKEVVDEAVCLGPLEELLEDESVTEIMVVSWDKIYVERSGKLTLSDKQFTDDNQVIAVMRRILSPIGRRIDETTPMADGRLQDGSRVNAIIPPLALSGPALTIRKFSKTPFEVNDLVRFGSLTSAMADFLDLAVRNRKNILISGGTGSGKTTLLNVISGFIPEEERIVTAEDAAELQLPQSHVVSLESRPANLEGKNAIVIRDLVRNALRMRPDRIVVGECRGGEALDMLQAMNTGHDGSLTTLHANSPRDAISRLETLVLMAGMELPSRAIREQITSAVDLIVQISRLSDGSRKVINITAVSGMEGDVVTLQDIFVFEQDGFDQQGKITGNYIATGMIPDFVHELRKRGIKVDISMFASAKKNDNV